MAASRDNPFADSTALAAPVDMTPDAELGPAMADALAHIADNAAGDAHALKGVVRQMEALYGAMKRVCDRLDAIEARGQAVAESLSVQGRALDVVRTICQEVRTQTVPPSMGNSPKPVDYTQLERDYRATLDAHGIPMLDDGRPSFANVHDVGTFYRVMSGIEPKGQYTTAQGAVQGPNQTRAFADVRRMWAYLAATLRDNVQARRRTLEWLASPPMCADLPFASRYTVIREGVREAGRLMATPSDAAREKDETIQARLAATLAAVRARFPADPGHMKDYLPG